MIDVAFISDLHLHPQEKMIQARFDNFIKWALGAVDNLSLVSIKQLYILGDFFHAWAGDDAIDDWSRSIALQIRSLVNAGIKVYYMHGNRDFLLGEAFACLSGWHVIKEPTVISLDDLQILLVHGDRYCTNDKKHQRFRLFTRNLLFTKLFLKLPLSYRNKIVSQIRHKSQMNNRLTLEQMDVVADVVIAHMQQFKVKYLIHGHTHKPNVVSYANDFFRYILSDWDDTPQILCYNKAKGLYFIQI